MASTCIENEKIFSCKFAPAYNFDFLACTTFKNHSSSDCGGVYVFRIQNHSLELVQSGSWPDAILDCTWHDSGRLLVTAGAGGSLQTWCVSDRQASKPLATVSAHSGAVTTVTKCPVSEYVVSGSIDKSVKQWNLDYGSLIHSFQTNDAVIQVAASSNDQVIFAITADRKLTYYDLRSGIAMRPNLSSYDIQSCDISYTNPSMTLVGCSSGMVSCHDFRMPRSKPVSEVKCHHGGVRRVRSSKFFPMVAISAGFDGQTVISDHGRNQVLERVLHHSDAVYDVDLSHQDPFLICDCSWDSLLHAFYPRSLRIHPLASKTSKF